MANIGKYKARAATRKSFLDNQQSIQLGDMERANAAQDYAEKENLWAGVSKAVIDIGQIAKEKKKASEFEAFKDAAGSLEGIATKSEEYQPLGGIGAVLGLDPKVRKSYFDKESGTQLTDSVMHALGKKTMMGMETRYDKAPEGSFVHDSFTEYEGKIQGDEPFKERMGDLKEVIGEKLSGVLSKAGLSKPDESPKEELPGPEDVDKSEYAGQYDDPSDAFKAEGSGSVDNEIIEESLTDFNSKDQNIPDEFSEAAEEMGLTREQIQEDSDAMAAESNALKLAKKQMGVLEEDPLGPEAAGDPEGSIVDALSEPDTFSLENASVDDVKKQLHSVFGKDAKELSFVMGMESSWGTDKDAKGNPFQLKDMKGEAEKAGVDISNVKQVGEFYKKKTEEMVKGFDNLTLSSGDKVNVFQMADSYGLNKEGLKYVAWQQGRGGLLDIVTASESGKLKPSTADKRIEKMMGNVTDDQKKILKDIMGGYTPKELSEKPMGTGIIKDLTSAFLRMQSDRMTQKGYTYKPDSYEMGRSPKDSPWMAEAAYFRGGDYMGFDDASLRVQQRKDANVQEGIDFSKGHKEYHKKKDEADRASVPGGSKYYRDKLKYEYGNH
tara:strand:+ start:1464 stop:3287 length:1824 start_codon:yes stop_codon:yes gene_type:complete